MTGYIAALAAVVIAFTINTIHHMHMFQLNSYKPREHWNWVKGNVRELIGVDIWYLIAVAMFAVGTIGQIAGTVLLLVVAWMQRPRKAKKPLVYTMRVKRMFLTMAVLLLILVVLASVFCGYVELTLVCGIALLLSPLSVLLVNLLNRPIELLINHRYIEDARKIMESMEHMTVIGVTGSYGKTSVKFYLQKLLSANYNVLVTPQNYNTTLGVVKTIREDLKATHDIFVCEMGAKNIGDIREICDLVEPQHGLITSIGPQHLESFKTIENVVRTKFELADAVQRDGMVFLNVDNEYIRQNIRSNAVTYGVEEKSAQYRPYDIEVSAKGSSFKMLLNGQECQFNTDLIGIHNVQNVAGAIAVAHRLEVPPETIVRQVRKLEGVEHRLQLLRSGQSILIDDAYNSNPSGAKAALDTLAMFEGAKIIVTPGMIELGERQYEENRVLGMEIAKVCDFVVLIGPKQTKPIKDGLEQSGFSQDNVFVASDLQEGMTRVNAWNSEGRQKVILLENDLPDNYES